MPLKRDNLERQLEFAQQKLDAAASELTAAGIAEKDLKRQPRWKAAKANYRAIKTRLMSVSAKEAISAAKAEAE
ncbi:MAG TPA: hypothetical protein VMM56_12430 [Planctomycetaceae bacterium]|nr:hypothetical protein [Planctomycetaceae bacterium]